MSDFQPAELKVTVRQLGGGTRISIVGELDWSTAEDLRKALSELDLESGLDLTVDLTQLSFLDSSGMGVLVNATRRISSGGGRLTVTCGFGPARRALEVSGLAQFFGIDD